MSVVTCGGWGLVIKVGGGGDMYHHCHHCGTLPVVVMGISNKRGGRGIHTIVVVVVCH